MFFSNKKNEQQQPQGASNHKKTADKKVVREMSGLLLQIKSTNSKNVCFWFFSSAILFRMKVHFWNFIMIRIERNVRKETSLDIY